MKRYKVLCPDFSVVTFLGVKILDSRVGFLCCFILLHSLYLFDEKPMFGNHISYLVHLFIYGLFNCSFTVSYCVASVVWQ
jgi:hypothetical protein